MKEPKTIRGLFSQAGFVAESKLHGVFGDRNARVIRLKRLKKQEFALCAGGAAEGKRSGVYQRATGHVVIARGEFEFGRA